VPNGSLSQRHRIALSLGRLTPARETVLNRPAWAARTYANRKCAMATIYRLCADLVLILHLGFVAFVVFGALLVLRWPKVMGFHLAAATWGALTEFLGLICPLTPLEVRMRELGGQAGYSGDFIDHYVTSILYPVGLTRDIQFWLGILVVVPNVLFYVYFLWRRYPSSR
jgi:hypothetical protein